MSLTIELLADPAANDLRLRQLIAARSSPLDRMNILHGSALQRLSTQRMLAEANGGALAAVYGFTPADLAGAAARLGEAGQRRAWPAGTDLAALGAMLGSIPLRRLNPEAPGIGAAMLRTLTDLREAALTPDELPAGELQTVFAAWREVVSGCADRTSRYEDAVSAATSADALREALGGAPVIVSGIYDLTRIQRLLLARLSEATSVRMLLVAPSDDATSPAMSTLAALRREISARVIRSTIPAQRMAADHFFSAGDPRDEADEVATRILELGREQVPFHRVAVLHQQGASADDRICAALERAGVPSWRIGGRQLAQTPIGHAARTLAGVLLDPDAVERGGLLDWLSHRALRERIVGVERRLGSWEGVALDAGLGRGLHLMCERLARWQASNPSEDAADLVRVLEDLSERSRKLAASGSWSEAAGTLLESFDDYVAEGAEEGSEERSLLKAARDMFEQVRANDGLGMEWSAGSGLAVIDRAFGSRVVRDPRRLIGGVNVGAATGPARGIRYRAIFAVGVAERVFPAVGREDPLLTDNERAAINAGIADALALQRDRADSDRHAWALMRRAAGERFTASWSRRSSATGGPARASSLILESASGREEEPGAMRSEALLVEQGRIERISNVAAAPATGADDSEAQEWSSALESPNEGRFELDLLSSSDVDIGSTLAQIWPGAEAADHARLRRNAPEFTAFDGLLGETALPDNWRPLDRSWSAGDLETLVTCPYRFYLMQIVGVGGNAERERPDRPRRDAHGRIVRQILSSWVREYEHYRSDRTWFEYADTPQFMNATARRVLDKAAEAGLLGPAAAVSSVRNETLRDLDRARRREAADARDGWRPLAVNVRFEDVPIRVTGGRAIRLRGLIQRIDEHVGGRRRALNFFTSRVLPEVRGFVNGSSFRAVAALSGLTGGGFPVAEAEVEHRSVTHRGNFESQTLRGDSLRSAGGRGAASDAERLRDALATIADELEAGRFIPYPGHPAGERPNCAHCPVESSCTADVGRRYLHKSRHDPEMVRALETLRRQRI